MNNNKSVATIENPEFINLTPLDINPLMSSCDIKVLYVGQNRNRSFITKEVATEMSKTLRGCPIVGWFRSEKDDFGDHGEQVVIDGNGIQFNCLTMPYGFVAPDAKVWFQNFEDTDEFGNTVVREYLMTTGYLWTGQFEEAKKAVLEGKGQSMELDGDTVDGHWATDQNSGLDFFIINDATFSKLCILGDDVEPCFEGASVTAPEISKTFSKGEDTFKNTLYSMMQDLKFALEGGKTPVENELEKVVEVQDETEKEVVENFEETTEEVVETPEATETIEEEAEAVETEVEDTKTVEEEAEAEVVEEAPQPATESEEYKLLSEQHEELKQQYAKLKTDFDALVEFKNTVEDKQKDALINKFYMLDDSDKADVIANKRQYTLEEIESKLAVIGYRKGISFSAEDSNKFTSATVEIDDTLTDNLPDWVKAVKEVETHM